MFDIGFSELILLFVVGLIVLGPQRLPVAIRTVMGWIRTIRSLATNVQNEFTQELKLKELQESIPKAVDLNDTVEELRQSAQKIKTDLQMQATETKFSLEEQAKELKSAVQNIQHFEKEKNFDLISEQLSPAELAEIAEENEPTLEISTDSLEDELLNTKQNSSTNELQNTKEKYECRKISTPN